jgi:DNA-binding NarL/FixJ family response regulator
VSALAAAQDAPAKRVLVLDAHETVLWGVRFVLVSRGVARRCLLSSSVLEAVAFAGRYEPHVAILGSVPPVASADAAAALRRARPGLRLLQLVDRGSGACDADLRLARDAPVAELEAAVRALTGQPAAAEAPDAGALSARQREVLAGLASGMTNQQIAACIGLSSETVKWHVRALCKRLGARNRTEVVARAGRAGWDAAG